MDQANYLKRYPEAIQDKDRAHEMALAGNKYRTQAALSRLEAIFVDQIQGDGVPGFSLNRLEDRIYRQELGYITDALTRGDISEDSADYAVHEIIDCQTTNDRQRVLALPLAIQAIRSLKSIDLDEEPMSAVISRKLRSAKRYDARAEAKERIL